MRTTFLFLALFLVIPGSCTEEFTDNLSNTKVPTELVGKWNWDYSTGGFAGITYTPKSSGESKKVEFDSDYNYKYYVNGILISSIKFDIKKSPSIFSTDSALIINSDVSPVRQSFVFKTSDTLILRDECFDCFEHHYSRIK